MNINNCIKIMNSDKRSKPNTTESASLAKARPAWKRIGRRVTSYAKLNKN